MSIRLRVGDASTAARICAPSATPRLPQVREAHAADVALFDGHLLDRLAAVLVSLNTYARLSRGEVEEGREALRPAWPACTPRPACCNCWRQPDRTHTQPLPPSPPRSSVIREFRAIATLTAAQLVTSWTHVSLALGEARDTAQRQLAAEERRKGGKVGAQAAALRVHSSPGCDLPGHFALSPSTNALSLSTNQPMRLPPPRPAPAGRR